MNYCYGTLVYSNPTTQELAQKMSGASVVSVTVDNYSTCAFENQKTIFDCTGRQSSAWIVSARSCCVRFINVSGNRLEDESTVFLCLPKPEKSTVSFPQIASPDSGSELKDYRIVALDAP